MDTEGLTNFLAIWGAVTGTLGTVIGLANLRLRIKQHKKDQPNLVCVADFQFENYSGKAIPKHKLILRSLGNRPVTIDFIRYCHKPHGFWNNVLKKRVWKNKLCIYDQKPKREIHLTEGKKADIPISLPKGMEIEKILKVEVHDQAGKVWYVDWLKSKKLKKLVYFHNLHESEIKNNNNTFKVIGYVCSDRYFVYVSWNSNTLYGDSITGRYFQFNDKVKFEQKIKDLNEVQGPKILSSEISDVL